MRDLPHPVACSTPCPLVDVLYRPDRGQSSHGLPDFIAGSQSCFDIAVAVALPLRPGLSGTTKTVLAIDV